MGPEAGDGRRIHPAFCGDRCGADAVCHWSGAGSATFVETASLGVRRRRIANGGLRRPDWCVLDVPRPALAGSGADRHDAGAFLYGYCYAGDE